MRDRRGALGACLAEVQGEDSDKLPRSLRTQESPHPFGAPSWAKKPAVGLHGNPHGEMSSSAVRSDRSEASLLLPSGTTALPRSKGSVRRNCASPVAQSETVALFFAPAEECVAGGSCGVEGALLRDWLRGAPRATESHRGRCCRGEPWGLGLRCHEKPSEMGVSEDEPRAALEMRGSESEPSCLRSVLSLPLHVDPHVLLNDGTEGASPGRSKPALSEPTDEDRKLLASVERAAGDPQETLGLQAECAFQVAELLRRS
ncbi:protein FAM220A [Artibeus jamaicensis]|uniref:protein FAM220A n=1 Tax=Artibeus jamaicensis TaxID=9417 RepID=UPI00235A897C|nr:protein FAM220A [Artibeus jamaicensis]